jgi:hypothetical protein
MRIITISGILIHSLLYINIITLKILSKKNNFEI